MSLLMDLSEVKRVSWYPGHMLKAEREIAKHLSLVDVVVVVLDARAPASAYNAELTDRLQQKGRVVVLNKTDLADPPVTRRWQAYWRSRADAVVGLQATSRACRRTLLPRLRAAAEAERQRRGTTRPRLRPVRAVIVGIPNVGKSSLINAVNARSSAKTGPKPGLTRHQQWVQVADDCELLDTPGIMVPRLADGEAGLRLGVIAALREEILNVELLAAYLLHQLARQQRLEALAAFGLRDLPETAGEVLAALAERWGLLGGGGQLNAPAAAARLVREFRQGRLGRLSLEEPEA